MIYVVIGIFIFSIVQLMIAFINYIHPETLVPSKMQTDELVSVLIPARNEEHNIGHILHDLTNHSYRNLEIIVFDDESTDRTAEIVQEFAVRDSRIRLVRSNGLPPGWLGKNYACHTLSGYAKGSFYLFLDADVRIHGNLIHDSLGFMKLHNLGLMSVFPSQIMQSPGEKATVPVMNLVLLSLLPLQLVRKSTRSSFAAANGQFMFFDASYYRKMLPHEHMKGKRVEDIEISRWYKKNGIRISCLTGVSDVRCRMYNGYREAVNGFSKNVIQFFGGSGFLAVLYGLVSLLGIVPIMFIMSVRYVLYYLIIHLLRRVFISLTSKQSVTDNLIYAIPQQLSLVVFIFRAIISERKGGIVWKGRYVS